MPDLWEGDLTNDDFELPGDKELVARMTGQDSPAVETESSETPAVENVQETTERPRDEKGRFTSTTEEPAEQVAETETEPELILGKFKSYEDLQNAYLNLEQHTGSLRNELGQLRQVVEERIPERPQAITPQPQYDPQQLQEYFSENPASIMTAIQQSVQEGNDVVTTAALAALSDFDPVGAEQARMAVYTYKAEQRILSQQQQREAAAKQQNTVVVDTVNKLTEANPSFRERADDVMSVIQSSPILTAAIASGDAGQVESALTLAYQAAGGRAGDNLTAAAKNIAREQALAADEAIKEAAVASTTATAVEHQPTAAERIAAEWDKADAPFIDGWNV